MAEEPQFSQAIVSSFLCAGGANAGGANAGSSGCVIAGCANDVDASSAHETSKTTSVSSDILSDSQSLTSDIVLSDKSSVFSPSQLIGELVSSGQASDLSALCTPGALSFTPGIVSVSELSASELAQSVIDKIQCPEGTVIWIGDTGA